MHGQHIPTDPLSVAGLIVVQVLVGLAFAFAVSALLTAVQTAGGLADIASGFSFGATVDPINGNQGGAFARLYMMIGTAMFIAIGGDAWMLRGISRTFKLVPLTKAPQITSLVNGAEQAFAQIFVAAIEVAAPVLLALLITDVAFGMVSRVGPAAQRLLGRLPAEGGRRDARRRRLAAVPRRLDVRPDLHVGRHCPALPFDRLSLSHGPRRQDREADSQAQEARPVRRARSPRAPTSTARWSCSAA